MSLTEALLAWASSCFGAPLSRPSDCSDGVGVARILHGLDAHHFSQKWLATIKSDIPSENVRLKSSNVKKVLGAITDYYSDVLGLQLADDFPRPDAARVAEGDPASVGRLLQLLLGCAINCEQKQRHIETIMGMEESVQRVIMRAIQELMNVQSPVPAEASATAAAVAAGAADLRKMADDLAEANREREALKQKVHDLENKVTLVEDHKNNVLAELELFQKRSASGGGADASLRDPDSGILSKELKRQLESLQDELFKSEGQRDEAQVKADLLEKQLEEAQAREAENQKLADQALKLKDEVDILRDAADKAAKYEATIDSYKKKMEDLGDLRRQVKLLEEKNTDYMQRNMELEEDVKKTGNWRPQVETYKKQIAELRAKIDSETKKSDRLEFDNKKLLEKVEALSVERDRLQAEREDLKVRNDDLADEINFGQAVGAAAGAGRRKRSSAEDDEDISGTLEMIPPAVKERLVRLQHENRQLRRQQREGGGAGGGGGGSSSADSDLMQTMVDDLREREKSLEAENRKANQKIMELESKLEEQRGLQTAPPRIPGSREELELKVAEANKKISQLNETLQRKEVEIHGMEERYKRYIEKAKSVIRTLDPKASGGNGGQTGGGNGSSSGSEVTALRSQISDKDRLIETMEQDNEKARAVREMEERLISSAFYNLSMQLHRNAVEARLNSHHHGQGQQQQFGQQQHHHQQQPGQQSFLARQRQVGRTATAAAAAAAAASSRGAQQPAGGYGSAEFTDY